MPYDIKINKNHFWANSLRILIFHQLLPQSYKCFIQVWIILSYTYPDNKILLHVPTNNLSTHSLSIFVWYKMFMKKAFLKLSVHFQKFGQNWKKNGSRKVQGTQSTGSCKMGRWGEGHARYETESKMAPSARSNPFHVPILYLLTQSVGESQKIQDGACEAVFKIWRVWKENKVEFWEFLISFQLD